MPRPTADDIEQLQNVKAGDNIVVTTFNGYHHEWRVCEVSRVTMHRIYCANIWCFTKEDGKQYGGISRYRAWAYPATTEHLAKVEDFKRERAEVKLHGQLRQYLNRTSFRHAPLERLELAVAILKSEFPVIVSDNRQQLCANCPADVTLVWELQSLWVMRVVFRWYLICPKCRKYHSKPYVKIPEDGIGEGV